MKLNKLSDIFSTTGQISSSDFPVIRALGFRSVICNRPDGEDIAQQLFKEIEPFAANAGLEIAYVPISRTGADDDTLRRFQAAFDRLPKPVLAFSGTGSRCQDIYKKIAAGT
ncbi:beta-lactamase hydrolase domain-containing protein [Litoreibacter roseus]|uniref:Beta-lactamase hydrolase-like protein phosphatase-like domain-containing protein n=1 Tax=Litoreibacter roseus TaxID=2601869 RepID=A0A6N6JBT4_9RHOB|nr:sulfur transferase domain-containing protein [Litoreibacter roseus]GFE63635.1 hypothetical protein KIN_07090 [Litoreibacter roseus]